jgi:3D (Asp-Asp-Asp) domain-containing protein
VEAERCGILHILEVRVLLHVYTKLRGKLCVTGMVAVLLITAFGPPPHARPHAGVDVTPEVSAEVLPPSKARFARAELVGEVQGPSLPVYTLRATAYNSVPEQTNSQPFVTATGTRTRFGIIAVSRDLLPKHIPYGSLVRIRDLGNFHDGRGYGRYQAMLDGQDHFIVEDTLNIRKQQQIDLWFETVPQALEWGVRRVEVEVVRYGRDGPFLQTEGVPIEVAPVLTASR